MRRLYYCVPVECLRKVNSHAASMLAPLVIMATWTLPANLTSLPGRHALAWYIVRHDTVCLPVEVKTHCKYPRTFSTRQCLNYVYVALWPPVVRYSMIVYRPFRAFIRAFGKWSAQQPPIFSIASENRCFSEKKQ